MTDLSRHANMTDRGTDAAKHAADCVDGEPLRGPDLEMTP